MHLLKVLTSLLASSSAIYALPFLGDTSIGISDPNAKRSPNFVSTSDNHNHLNKRMPLTEATKYFYLFKPPASERRTRPERIAEEETGQTKGKLKGKANVEEEASDDSEEEEGGEEGEGEIQEESEGTTEEILGAEQSEGIGRKLKGGEKGKSTEQRLINLGKIASDKYPCFPKPGKTAFSDFGKSTATVAVQKYFHNVNEDLDNWNTKIESSPKTMDTAYQSKLQEHAPKNTFSKLNAVAEHPFEAQTITRFFTEWLVKSAKPQREPRWIRDWFLIQDSEWNSQDSKNGMTGQLNAARRMANELGTGQPTRQNRLTVFLEKPNMYKGILSGNKPPISDDTIRGMKSDLELLTALKDLGMIFTYMALDEVIESFCATYAGIHDILKQFDSWNPSKPPESEETSEASDHSPSPGTKQTAGPSTQGKSTTLTLNPKDPDRKEKKKKFWQGTAETPKKEQGLYKSTTNKINTAFTPLKKKLRGASSKEPAAESAGTGDSSSSPKSAETKGPTKMAIEWQKHVQNEMRLFVENSQRNIEMIYRSRSKLENEKEGKVREKVSGVSASRADRAGGKQHGSSSNPTVEDKSAGSGPQVAGGSAQKEKSYSAADWERIWNNIFTARKGKNGREIDKVFLDFRGNKKCTGLKKVSARKWNLK